MNRRHMLKASALIGAVGTADIAEATDIEPNALKLVGEFDAREWARMFVAYVERKPSIATDEGCMIGWFANAIMSGYHRGRRDERDAAGERRE